MTNNSIGRIGPARYTKGGQVSIKGRYIDNSLALIITSKNGPEATATVCLAPDGPPAPPGFVWLKGWSGNEGIPEALEKAGILKRNGTKSPTGFVFAELAELSDSCKKMVNKNLLIDD